MKPHTSIQDYDYHGCLTGDCPHEKESQCDAALKEHYKSAAEDVCNAYGVQGIQLHDARRVIEFYAKGWAPKTGHTKGLRVDAYKPNVALSEDHGERARKFLETYK